MFVVIRKHCFLNAYFYKFVLNTYILNANHKCTNWLNERKIKYTLENSQKKILDVPVITTNEEEGYETREGDKK